MTLWNIPDVLDSFSWKGRGNALEGSFLAIPQEISRARRCWKQGEGRLLLRNCAGLAHPPNRTAPNRLTV